MNIIKSHMATSHPKVICLAPIRVATIYERGNVGTLGLIWPIVLEPGILEFPLSYQELKSVWLIEYYAFGITHLWKISVFFCLLFEAEWFTWGGGGLC